MIKTEEYRRRRQQLMQMAGEGSVIVLVAAAQRIRNNDVHYPYRQDSDFHYLSGFPEPQAVMVLLAEGKTGQSVLFCSEKDPKRELWDGPMVGVDDAQHEYGMDKAYPITELETRLPRLLKGRERIYYDLGKDAEFDQKLIGWMNALRHKTRRLDPAPEEIIAVDHLLHEMRLFKSRAEIAAMRRAAKVASAAHRQAMKVCQPGMNEAQICAELMREFYAQQCEPSYLPIVGGGPNACVLHYIANNQPLADGDLLLIDAGAEHNGYASDITRTFPVNGRYSPEQAAIYEVVLDAQLAALDKVQTGNVYTDIHDAAVKVIAKGLRKLGLLQGTLRQILRDKSYQQFYMHNTGHWLGLDVHDVGDYVIDGESRMLEPGMALTVEPGIYIAPGDNKVGKAWRGIGVRIEDDVVVNRKGPDVLSKDTPKTLAAVEKLMAA